LAWCIVLVRLVLPASWVSRQAVRLPAAYDVCCAQRIERYVSASLTEVSSRRRLAGRARPAGQSRPHRRRRDYAQGRCACGPRRAASTPRGHRGGARPASSSTRSTPSHPGHPVAGQPLGQHIRPAVVVVNGGSRRSAHHGRRAPARRRWCPRPPRQTYQRARGTKHQRRPDDQPISHPSQVAEHGHQRLIRSTAQRRAIQPIRWSCDSVSPTRMG